METQDVPYIFPADTPAEEVRIFLKCQPRRIQPLPSVHTDHRRGVGV